MRMGRKEEREKKKNMVGGENDRRHQRGLSLAAVPPAMASSAMKPPIVARCGQGLEREKKMR